MRLRIAVIVALLRVGAAHQVSTHPGLLLMDSPKAEEIQIGQPDDIATEKMTRDLRNLQPRTTTHIRAGPRPRKLGSPVPR